MFRPALHPAALLPCIALTLFGFAAAQAQQTFRVPADRPTIQAGIDAASPGDTVLVAPGTYLENIDFKGKAITLRSSDGATKTIIDGSQGLKPAVFFTHGETRASVLDGFTVQNGGDETHTGTPGGILLQKSAPTLQSNIITHNHCYGVLIQQSSPLFVKNEISNTLSAGSCGFAGGSGVWLQGSLPVANGPRMHPQFFDNLFENNTQSGQEDAGGNGGAGIAVWGGSPILQNNIFRNNRTFAGTGGAINVVSDDDGVTIIHNLIYGNEAGCGGGGLAFHFGTYGGPGSVVDYIENNTIVGNTTNGSCGFSDHGPASQIYLWRSTSRRVFVNNIIVGATSNPAITDDTSYDAGPFGLNIFDHNLVWNPQGKLVGGNLVDPTGTFGNISADPHFLNQAAFDFHLTPGSPAVDTGNNSSPNAGSVGGNISDLDGNYAPQDATGKGYPVLDIGAYELPGPHDIHATLIHLLPSAYQVDPGVPVTLNATLISANGVPAGTVTFFEDGNQVGALTADPTGLAVLQLPGLIPGLHTFLATYPGQGSFTPSTSVEVVILVTQYVPTLKLTSSPNPSLLGQPVNFTATISSPDNTVLTPLTLADNGATLATLTPDANGRATFSTTSLTAGAHSITVTYAGDSTHTSARDSVQQQVTDGYPTSTAITSLPNPAASGQTVTFAVDVSGSFSSGAPTGSVTLSEGSTVLGTQPLTSSGATASSTSFSISTLSLGSHTITATYVPTGVFVASSASLNQVIAGQPTSTVLIASPNPADALSSVTLSATVTSSGSVPSGSVTFFDGAIPLGSASLNPSGSAIYPASFGSAGSHLLHATYAGNTTLNSSTSNTVTETVRINSTTTSLTVSPPPSVTAFSTITLTSVTRSPSSARVSTPACNPTCTSPSVAFLANGNVIGSAALDANGSAVLTVALPHGTYSFSSAFAATPAFSSSTSAAVLETVTPATPNITLAAQPNPAVQSQTVTVTANLATPPISASAITGTVTFLDGGSPLGTASVSSAVAILTVNTLTAGTHQISAVYSGTADLAAVSAVTTVTVLARDFTITPASPTLTIKTEHHAPIRINLTTTGALVETVHLSCGNLPEFATCTFDSPDVTTSADPAATRFSTLTVDTDAVEGYARTQPAPGPSFSHPLFLALLLPITLLGGFASRSRRLPRLLLAALLAATFALTLNGCSGKYPGHTPPGTYAITIIGQGRTSGTTHTSTLGLTVTP